MGSAAVCRLTAWPENRRKMRRMVRAPKKALDFALELGKSMGFRVGNVDNHAGYIEYGEGEEMVAVLGHMDVVPTGDAGSTRLLEARSMTG